MNLKCPNCGGRVAYDPQVAKVVCEYCRWESTEDDFSDLEGRQEFDKEEEPIFIWYGSCIFNILYLFANPSLYHCITTEVDWEHHRGMDLLGCIICHDSHVGSRLLKSGTKI